MSEQIFWQEQLRQLKEAENQRKAQPAYQARYTQELVRSENGYFRVACGALCDGCGSVGAVLVADSSMEEYAAVTICLACLHDLLSIVQT